MPEDYEPKDPWVMNASGSCCGHRVSWGAGYGRPVMAHVVQEDPYILTKVCGCGCDQAAQDDTDEQIVESYHIAQSQWLRLVRPDHREPRSTGEVAD